MTGVPGTAQAAHPRKAVVVTTLGITQILAWGSTFYLLGVLAPFISRDTGWSYDLIVGGVSLGLLVAGLVSPSVGRLIGQRGGRPVLAVSALLLAGGLFGLGMAPNLVGYFGAWVIIGLGMGAGLYDAAFSTLGSIYGAQSRSAITSITLFGGFASTVCWPFTAFLVEHLGWRETCLCYAAIQISIALPIYLMCLPQTSAASTEMRHGQVRLEAYEVIPFCILAAIITIGSAILSLMGTHLLPLLQARGFDLSLAVGIGMIVGPSQVGARFVEMLAGRRYHPIWTMVASVVLVALASAMLLAGFPVVALAIALYGAGNGLGSVARGTVPLALFGPDRYPVLMGRLALPLMISMALSPFVGGLAFQRGGALWTLMLLAALALTNVLLIVALWSQLPKNLHSVS
jgi:predicted MFS family arabinose efflux permease